MPYGVVLHCGTFRSAWDLIIFICTIYVAALVPYQAVFKREGYELAGESDGASDEIGISFINRSFDVFVEAVFIFDVILNFRTTYVSKSGNVVFNPKLITKNYFKSWFSVDLFAAIPGTLSFNHLPKLLRSFCLQSTSSQLCSSFPITNPFCAAA